MMITRKILTLCLLKKDNQILLGMKKRGFGEGRWNGFGGKLEEGESIEEATIREMFEESNIKLLDLKKFGQLDFEFQDNLGNILEVHLFTSESFQGDPIETEEMRPQWFNISEIPLNEMWPDDEHWFPLFLENKKFKGRFLFGKNDIILEKGLIEVDII